MVSSNRYVGRFESTLVALKRTKPMEVSSCALQLMALTKEERGYTSHLLIAPAIKKKK